MAVLQLASGEGGGWRRETGERRGDNTLASLHPIPPPRRGTSKGRAVAAGSEDIREPRNMDI